VLLVALCVGAAGCGSSGSSKPSAATVPDALGQTEAFRVTGTWRQPAPAISNRVNAPGHKVATYTGTGGAVWRGSLSGTTELTLKATVNRATNARRATVVETFTGTLKGVGAGTLRLTGKSTSSSTGALKVTAKVVTGTGALTGMSGTITFTGRVDRSGAGTGAGRYRGTLKR
jgi:hypothetical protein